MVNLTKKFIMKRLPEIVIFCSMTFGLLTSGSTDKRSESTQSLDFLSQTEHDTTGYISLLKVDSFSLAIIPPSSGVRFFKDGIVFLSNTKDEGKMLSKHVSFGSIEAYTAVVRDTWLGLHIPFSPSASFSYPCEAITFTNDFKTMYYTKIGKKEKREKIYHAEYRTNEKGELGWITDNDPLEFCTGNYSYTHPALSSDGKLLIFASDRDGSTGVWISSYQGEREISGLHLKMSGKQ